MNTVSTGTEALAELNGSEAHLDIEELFRAHYVRVARMIARVVRDPGRSEELAVEVFLKLWRNGKARGENVEGWLYRVALRTGLDELRRRTRRARYESLLGFLGVKRMATTPEQIRCATEERERVRFVLGLIEPRQAEFLLLRSHGFSYEEVASILKLNPASVGTLVRRAQQTFRKEYVKRYGQESFITNRRVGG
jgi:RNA polymerase sigma-70 factor, ECF subfamily